MNIGKVRKFETIPQITKRLFTERHHKLGKLTDKKIIFWRYYGSENRRLSDEKQPRIINSTPRMGEDRGQIPEPKRRRISGLSRWIVSLISSDHALRLHEHVDEMHKKLGPIYRDRVGPVNAVFVNSPDDFRKIFRMEGPTPMHFLPEAWGLYNRKRQCPRGLLFMDGLEWMHFRKIMNRVMLVPNPAHTMAGPCQQAARDLVHNWKCFADTGHAIPDLATKLYRWSIHVMLATLTGSCWDSYKSRVDEKTKDLAQSLHKIFALSARLSLLPAKWAMKLHLPVWQNFCSVADDALNIVRSLVLEMAQLEGDGLLAMMAKEGISTETDLVRIVTDLVIAAGDTTAFSTQWSLFLLAKNPAIQDKLYQRINRLNQKEIMSDAFIKAIVKEAMRLYPVAPFLTRMLPEDSVIAGYHVPKKELIIMSVYSSSRDPNNFPQPNDFIPERWMRNEEGSYGRVTNPHGTLPFALGSRSCVGRKLAETQMILTLTEIVKNFRIECSNAERVKMILHLISVPSEPIQLKLYKRQ